VAGGVERLAAQQAVGEDVGADGHLDLVHDEALDVVHVQAFVDPGHQQRVGIVGLGADLAHLARLHLGRIDEQGEDTEGGLGHRHRARAAPAAHPDIGLDLEVLPAGGRHRRSPKRA
jgi:hypothetical protein